MKWTAPRIASALARITLKRGCVALLENTYFTGYEADMLTVTNDLRLIDIEIKVSRADFKADAAKDKWWQSWRKDENGIGRRIDPPVKRDHPFKVWKHYFAMPEEIWADELTKHLPSESCGLILLKEHGHGDTAIPRVVRRAKPRPKKDCHFLTPAECITIARLSNLRMWDAMKAKEIA